MPNEPTALSYQAYRDRAGHHGSGDDPVITTQLDAVIRLLGRRLGRNFLPGTVGDIRYYTRTTPMRVTIDDFSAITAVAVDLEGGSDYETTITSTYWYGAPYNAAAEGMPYTQIELRHDTPTVFPAYRHSIKVTGTTGFAETPAAVRELAILVTRQLRDLQRTGITVTAQAVDSAVQLAPGASGLMKDIRVAYKTAARMTL